MAKTAMVKSSSLKEWPDYQHTGCIKSHAGDGFVRFCKNGHRVYKRADFSDNCTECKCEFTAQFHDNTVVDIMIPVPIKPIRYERKWVSIEAFDRDGDPLGKVRKRIRVPIFDVSSIPEDMWKRHEFGKSY